jgi:hypothetical protein
MLFARSKTSSAKTIHNMIHISVKMLHRCEIVTHTPQEYTMLRHISCISISATMRDITHVSYMYHTFRA